MRFKRLCLTQPAVARRLEEDFENGLLSQSVLFHGKGYSSRMTGAVECALSLTGESDRYFFLDTPNLIVLENRDSTIRINALRNLYEKQKTKTAFLNLIHETRLLLLSCHEALYTNSDRDVFSAAGELSEILYPDAFIEGNPEAFLKEYDRCLGHFLQKKRKSSAFTIDQIRSIQSFFNQNSGQNKAVILENIEDVTAGAMNSILKILEEPPEGAYIILVSANPRRILATILSRVRQYAFPAVPAELQKMLVSQAFHSQSDSIESFFYSASGLDMNRLTTLAEEFVYHTLKEKRLMKSEDFTSLCSFLEKSSAWDLFVSSVVSIIEESFIRGELKSGVSERILSLITSVLSDMHVYNQSRALAVEHLERGLVAIEQQNT